MERVHMIQDGVPENYLEFSTIFHINLISHSQCILGVDFRDL